MIYLHINIKPENESEYELFRRRLSVTKTKK